MVETSIIKQEQEEPMSQEEDEKEQPQEEAGEAKERAGFRVTSEDDPTKKLKE